MKANRLHLNPQKTQLIWLGCRQQLEKLTMVDIELMSASLSVFSETDSVEPILLLLMDCGVIIN